MAKLLYRWNNRKFEKEYLKKLKKNWRWWKNDQKELEWEENEQTNKVIWEKDITVSPEEKP